MTPVIIKLGGSAAQSAALDGWCAALAVARLPLVVVPGGGPFADQVRFAQTTLGFSDAAAHAMAILAMDQFGHAIADTQERFTAARSLADIAEALGAGRIPVWLPSAMATPANDIPISWDVTSDSLAAWLAKKLAAPNLVLVKQARIGRETLAGLAARGVVDPCLPHMLPPATDLRIAGPDDLASAAALLAAGRLPGSVVARIAKAG